MASRKKIRSVAEIDIEIKNTQAKLTALRAERTEALQRELQQTSANLLKEFRDAFNTDDKEMSLEDLTTFVKENIAKAQEEREQAEEPVEDVELVEEDVEPAEEIEEQSSEEPETDVDAVEQDVEPHSVFSQELQDFYDRQEQSSEGEESYENIYD